MPFKAQYQGILPDFQEHQTFFYPSADKHSLGHNGILPSVLHKYTSLTERHRHWRRPGKVIPH